MLYYDTISCALDLNAAGKRSGWVNLAHSDHIHAYSAIRSPIGWIGSGSGPVALIVGGNHGDEYEGQIIARRLFAELQPEDMLGGAIFLPALNMSAVTSRSRISPLDGGNMNRAFPGGEGQGPTRGLAGFVTRHLIPRAQLVLDIHSGGGTSEYLDATYLTLTGNAEADRHNLELARVFALPWTMVVPMGSTGGDLDSAALAAGCAMISCELGGMGTLSRNSLRLGWQGALRLLAAQRIITDAAADRLGRVKAEDTRFVDMGGGSRHVTAMTQALAEPLVGLADHVEAGQPVVKLHPLFDLGAERLTLTAPVAGYVAIRRTGAMVQPGDHVLTITPGISPDTLT
ncbi:succinylglutamate desuccinylase/aspartoacylase domain-containing protein [Paracoccus sp. (in: a-proteobacteria)]|uniref:succinylglutamate desuccinylase/aspartoacylase domain-containing protein n=1 Tax=Paracoccus sp. TaxID=267 RepID=UPI002AFE8BBF|nr:succinylglutamate desuccinylase/aspartoacylase family protein [Paracoccus sp. (in: a-proteobacteria)]